MTGWREFLMSAPAIPSGNVLGSHAIPDFTFGEASTGLGKDLRR